ERRVGRQIGCGWWWWRRRGPGSAYGAAAEVGGVEFAIDPGRGTVVAARTADRLFVEAANVFAPDFRRDVVEVGGQFQQLFAHEPVGVDTAEHSFGEVGRLGHEGPVPAWGASLLV